MISNSARPVLRQQRGGGLRNEEKKKRRSAHRTTAHIRSAKIQPVGWTSYVRKTLYEIPNPALKGENYG